MLSRILPAFALLAAPASAAELHVYPPAVELTGPRATQQLVVADHANGRAVADRTAAAAFASDKPAVAAVDAAGLIHAAGDGEATVTATVDGRAARVTVRVRDFGRPAGWSFRHHVEPTLTRTGCNSGACHGALAGKGGFKLSLRAYDPETDHYVLTRQALARRVDTAKPDESLLLLKGAREIRHAGGMRFDPDSDHYKLLREWIAAGAPGPADADPLLVKVEVFPPALRLKPKDAARLVVRATYSDGRQEDVTRWAKFASSEEQVATVDEDGNLAVVGHGEAGVTALFGDKLATAAVASPFRNAVAATAFAPPPGAGYVDRLILAKLQALNLPPSPPATDAEFVRRAYLDVCGVLPPPAAAAAFVADADPKKREKLVDRLLDSPEYVDYWAHKWSDLLLVSSRKLPAPAVWAFYRTVRRAVADNRPWDRFARDILTASGSTLENGGGNFFALHKDLAELAESTATTFLGQSIGCAKCHNHPLEKWTQDQYWAFTNLFARVGLKDGPRGGEVIVRSLPTGDVPHLRRGVPVPPAPLDGKPLPLDGDADRRQYLADWMTDPANKLFARAVVNRVWRAYLGRGLVEPEDDLRETNPPSNAELLDALTADFVAHRYDLKHLARTILTSAAYGRSSRPLPANAADDRFYSRYLLRRLPAEVILDAYAEVTGVPTRFDTVAVGSSGGTRADGSYPPGTRAVELPDSQLVSRFLDAFGRAERVQTCACERTADATVTQALHLANGQTLNDKLRDPASRVNGWLTADDGAVVDELFRRALSRPPTPAERAKFVDALAAAGKDGRREAVEDAVWAVLTGKEFLFNH